MSIDVERRTEDSIRNGTAHAQWGQESCKCGVSADCSRGSAPWEMITFVERAREGSAHKTCMQLDS